MLLQIIDCFLSSLQDGFSTSFPGTTKSLFSNHFLIIFSISLCHLAPKPMSWVLMLSQQGWTVLNFLLSVRHHSELPPSSCSVKGMQGTTSSRIPFSKESDFTVWWDFEVPTIWEVERKRADDSLNVPDLWADIDRSFCVLLENSRWKISQIFEKYNSFQESLWEPPTLGL